jgi:hypothetical protein
MSELTDQDKECLRQLRKNGCAVTVFLPHEIGDADPDDVEERMCIAGWDEINLNGNVGEVI